MHCDFLDYFWIIYYNVFTEITLHLNMLSPQNNCVILICIYGYNVVNYLYTKIPNNQIFYVYFNCNNTLSAYIIYGITSEVYNGPY